MASYKNVTASGALYPGQTHRGSLCGWSVTASGACVVNFRDGSASGSIVATASTAGAGSQVVSLVSPVTFNDGIYVDIVSGTMTNIAVWID